MNIFLLQLLFRLVAVKMLLMLFILSFRDEEIEELKKVIQSRDDELSAMSRKVLIIVAERVYASFYYSNRVLNNLQ